MSRLWCSLAILILVALYSLLVWLAEREARRYRGGMWAEYRGALR